MAAAGIVGGDEFVGLKGLWAPVQSFELITPVAKPPILNSP